MGFRWGQQSLGPHTAAKPRSQTRVMRCHARRACQQQGRAHRAFCSMLSSGEHYLGTPPVGHDRVGAFMHWARDLRWLAAQLRVGEALHRGERQRCRAEAAETTTWTVDAVLSKMRAAAAGGCLHQLKSEVRVSGTGQQYGEDVEWAASFRRDGAFFEDSASPNLAFHIGWPARPGAPIWERDGFGAVREMQLDDQENALLHMSARSGFLLHPEASRHLHFLAAEPQRCAEAPDAETADLARDGLQASTSERDAQPPKSINLYVKVRGGRCVASVGVDMNTWRVAHVTQRIMGKFETWYYRDWKLWLGRFWFPGSMHLVNAADTVEHYHTQHASSVRSSKVDRYACPPIAPSIPGTSYDEACGPEVPTFITSDGRVLVQPRIVGADLGWMLLDSGASGLTIEPAVAERLGLRSFGRLVVSSVSGRVMSRYRVADGFQVGPLRMERAIFMELSLRGLVPEPLPGPVIGMIGYDVFARAVVDIPAVAAVPTAPSNSASSRRTAFRAAGRRSHPHADVPTAGVPQMVLPPLTQAAAEQAEAESLAGRGREGPVVRLWRSVPGAVSPGLAAAAGDILWQRLYVVSNLPGVQLSIDSADGASHAVMVILDSGACRTHFMLNHRTARALGLCGSSVLWASGESAQAAAPGQGVLAALPSSASSPPPQAHLDISGVSGLAGADDAQSALRLLRASFPSATIAGHKVKDIRVLYATTGTALEQSAYSAGLMCMDFMGRFRCIFDVPNKRIAILAPPC